MHLNFSVWLTRWPYLLQGAAISLEIVAVVLLLSTPLAMIAALGLGSTKAVILYPMRAISWILRGIPPLVILFAAYFVMPQFGISLTPLAAAIAGFTAYNTFVVAELIVAGFRSLDRGQHAAIAALGLPPFRAYRRILLPQALPSIVPPYISYSTDMVKGTALAGSIGVLELVTRANQVILATNRPFEILLGIAAIYGIVDAGLMGLQAVAERLWPPPQGGAGAMSFDPDLIVQALPDLLQSVLVTIKLFVLLMLIATPLSLAVALARVSSVGGLRWAAACYVNGIRCIPVLVILYFTFYGLPQFGFRIAPFTAALIGLTIGTVAYLAEDLRAGLIAIDRGQFQAADALGLGYWWRTRRIIVPQALPVMVGPYFTRAIVSLKATSMASIVAVNEVTGESMALLTETYRALEFLTFAAATYLALSAVLAMAQVILQRKVALP